METEYDYLFKIVLIGDAGVGKTSIVRRYTDGIFTSAGIPTIGVDFCIKTLQIGSSAVKVRAPYIAFLRSSLLPAFCSMCNWFCLLLWVYIMFNGKSAMAE